MTPANIGCFCCCLEADDCEMRALGGACVQGGNGFPGFNSRQLKTAGIRIRLDHVISPALAQGIGQQAVGAQSYHLVIGYGALFVCFDILENSRPGAGNFHRKGVNR